MRNYVDICDKLERARIREGPLASDERYAINGAFAFGVPGDRTIFCIASDGRGWEHVSVSLNKKRTPTWEEMCFVKELFWDDDECVVQFHPPKSAYVNNHPYVLHLWRPVNYDFRLPPQNMIGIKSLGVIQP